MPPSEGKAYGNYKPKKRKKKKFKSSPTVDLFLGKKRNNFANFQKGHTKKDPYLSWKHSAHGWGNQGKNKKGRKNSGSGSAGSGYGSGSSSGATGYSSGSSGGRSGGGGGRGGRGKGKPQHAYARIRAANMVKADSNSQILQLINQARGQKRAKDFDISSINALFDRTKGDLDYLFNESRDFNTAQSAKIDERYGATEADITQLYDDMVAGNMENTNARKQAAMAELQRLGIQQSGMGNFDADAQNQAGMAANNQANAVANLSAMREGSSEVGNLLQSMATGSQVSSTGQAMNTRNTGVSKAQQDFSQFMQDILGQTQVVRSQEFNKINTLEQQLKKNSPMKRSKKNKRKVLKSYAARNRTNNRLNKTLGGIR